MTPPHIPGNEPDPGDMATDPTPGGNEPPIDHELPDDEAERLGDFA